MLKATANENPATWPQKLPTLMSAYRMTVHKTTGITPNMAMLGREVMLPAALIARPPLLSRLFGICATHYETRTTKYA